MPLLSKASIFVQNIFFLYDVTGFTEIGHSIPVATKCKNPRGDVCIFRSTMGCCEFSDAPGRQKACI